MDQPTPAAGWRHGRLFRHFGLTTGPDAHCGGALHFLGAALVPVGRSGPPLVREFVSRCDRFVFARPFASEGRAAVVLSAAPSECSLVRPRRSR